MEKELTLREEIDRLAPQFAAALPPHIPIQRFVRVVMTAINGDADLLQADRRSLFESAMKAAQDGLLPDKREGAFIVFNTNGARKGEPARWIKKVQWMPMVWGLVKKVRNSGELASISAHVVHEKDEFSYQLGDDESITHKPALTGDRGPMVLAYAIIKTRDGAIYREIMTRDEIDAVRNVSKAKDSGPWAGPFASEMWKKSVIKRLCKRAPISTDLEQVLERDNDLYDLQPQPQAQNVVPFKVPMAIGDEGDVDSQPAGSDAAEIPPRRRGRPRKVEVPNGESTQPPSAEPPEKAPETLFQDKQPSVADKIEMWVEAAPEDEILATDNFLTRNIVQVTDKEAQRDLLRLLQVRRQGIAIHG